VDAGQVLVCSGFAQGLSLTLAALAARGIRHVGFRDPGYDRAVETTAHRAGVTAVPIPVDSRGIDVGALASSSAQAVVVSPAHQWPTGVVLAAGRRRELVAWAAEVDGFWSRMTMTPSFATTAIAQVSTCLNSCLTGV
jgi:GntR family transcriptional regulator / MocR family aminotransferase